MTRRFTTALMTALIVAVGCGTMACLQAAAVQTPKATTSGGTTACPNAEPETAPLSELPNAPAETPAYRFGKADGLNITVDPDYVQASTGACTKGYTIGADGKINFCNLGALTIEGLTEREVEAMITAEFQKKAIYIPPAPRVNAQVTAVKSQTVFLNGEVRTPGSTQIATPVEMTLMHALANAGGATAQAGPNIIILRPRRVAPGAEAQPLNIDADTITAQRFVYNRKQLMEKMLDPPIQAGDTIWVEQAEMFIINGEVKAGGIKVWEPCITVGDAINMASGMTDKGSLGRSHIQRKNAKGAFDNIKGLKLETYLLPKDVLVIGRKLF